MEIIIDGKETINMDPVENIKSEIENVLQNRCSLQDRIFNKKTMNWLQSSESLNDVQLQYLISYLLNKLSEQNDLVYSFYEMNTEEFKKQKENFDIIVNAKKHMK